MHEAGHKKNDDSGLINVAHGLTQQSLITVAAFTASSKIAPAGIPEALLGITAAYLGNWYNKVNLALEMETRADKFTCDHAQSTDVLQSGLNLFNYLTINDLDDPFHPNSHERASKVIDEIKRRRITDKAGQAQKDN